mmetsp:Transcript_35223/g.86418  ORF Transcript_35223/g.86418 Transcript_35223/m.86418 type:complete len:252 (+) Transcript_35223:1151-1906(+)
MADHRAPGGPPAPAGAAHLLAPKAGAHAQGDLLLPHCARHAARRRALHRAGPQGDGDPQPQEPGPPHQGRRPVPRGQERRHDVLRRQRARPRLPRRHPGHPDRPALLPRAVHPPPGPHRPRWQNRRGALAAGPLRGVVRTPAPRPAHHQRPRRRGPRDAAADVPGPGARGHPHQRAGVRRLAGLLQRQLLQVRLEQGAAGAARQQLRTRDPGLPRIAWHPEKDRRHDGTQGRARSQPGVGASRRGRWRRRR